MSEIEGGVLDTTWGRRDGKMLRDVCIQGNFEVSEAFFEGEVRGRRVELTSSRPLFSRSFLRLLEGTTSSSSMIWKLNWIVRIIPIIPCPLPSSSLVRLLSLTLSLSLVSSSSFFFFFLSRPHRLGIPPTCLSYCSFPPGRRRQLRPSPGWKRKGRLRSRQTQERRRDPQGFELPRFLLSYGVDGSGSTCVQGGRRM